MTTDVQSHGAGGNVFRDPRVRAVVYQAIVIVLFVAFVLYIGHNTAHNLEKRGIASGFGFLGQPAGFGIGIVLFMDYSNQTSTHLDVLIIGIINTLVVSFTGIFFATLIGFIAGILRLSKNWIVNKMAAVYIEVVRNIPLLVQLFFWYFAVLAVLPTVRDSHQIGSSIFVNNRGVSFPGIIPSEGFWLIPVALLVAIVLCVFVARWARKRQEATGQLFPVFWTWVGLVILLPVIGAAIMGFPFTIAYPDFGKFSIHGGWSLEPEFLSLLLGLSIYTGAFIAEIVRSGINSVSFGQTEAAHSLGLRPRLTTRLVILPQALRVIVPPLTSQYLNLIKNSSLATAIGYADITALFAGTSLNQTGQAIECIFITMLFYLSISLLISMFMNWYNKHISLVER
ncbi:MAG: amino acid ABC transporter permease [Alphaproteobacteria bacterium]|nr:MAG: amino acid ABC transporter permease [Alphaproteobacteria bacterium]